VLAGYSGVAYGLGGGLRALEDGAAGCTGRTPLRVPIAATDGVVGAAADAAPAAVTADDAPSADAAADEAPADAAAVDGVPEVDATADGAVACAPASAPSRALRLATPYRIAAAATTAVTTPTTTGSTQRRSAACAS
jgi:hypothetical protein